MTEHLSPNPPTRLKFSDFELLCTSQQLVRRKHRLHINGQPLQILQYLVMNQGSVVSRDQLKVLLWPNAAEIETNRRLNTAIRALRSLLDQTGSHSVEIETIRGVGYRLIEKQRPRFTNLGLVASLFVLVAVLAAVPLRLSSQKDNKVGLDDQQYIGLETEKPDQLKELPRHNLDVPPADFLRARELADDWRRNPRNITLQQAKKQLQSLIAQSSDNSDAYALLGELVLYGEWDWAQSEQHLKKALTIDPSNAHARRMLAWLYNNSERPAEAWAEIGVLLATEKLEPGIRADLGWLLLRMAEDKAALSLCYVPENLSRAHLNLLACRHTAYARMADMEKARVTAIDFMKVLQAPDADLKAVTSTDAETGYARFLEWRIRRLSAAENSLFIHAQLLAEAGHYDQAADRLKQAFIDRDPRLVKLNSTPELASLLTRPAIHAIWNAVRQGNKTS